MNQFTLQGPDRLCKLQALKSSALNIIYEVSGDHVLGFNGLYCFLWDASQELALLKVNTKGGNRPIRARCGKLHSVDADEMAVSEPKAIIAYAYGDCLALAFKAPRITNRSSSAIKQNLLPSVHGREIMAVLGLARGTAVITGSEDTTFKVLRLS